MKILRGLINFVLRFIIFTSIAAICSIYIVRSFLSGNNISDMLFSNNVISATEEYEEFTEYVDVEEIKETYGDILNEYLKYYTGVNKELPSTEGIEKILNDYCDKYEAETGNKVDRSFISENMKEIDKIIAETTPNKNDKISQAFSLIYSNKVITIAIIAFIVSSILVIVINKSILKLVSILASIFITNALCFYVLSLATTSLVNNIAEDLSVIDPIINSVKSILNNVGLISIIVGIVFIVLLIIVKVVKKSLNKKSSTPKEEQSHRLESAEILDTIESLENYAPQESIETLETLDEVETLDTEAK